MSTKTIVQKMLVKPGFGLLIINPPKGYLDTIGDLPDGAYLVESKTAPADMIQVFIKSQAEVDLNLENWLQRIKSTGIIWLTYPKLSSGVKTDLNRDILWKLVKSHGFDAVSMIAIDETWSAMRLKNLNS